MAVRWEFMMTNLALMVSLFLGAPQIQYADKNLGSLVRDQLFNEVVRMDRAADRQWVACRTAGELSERQRKVRRQAIAAIGGLPEKTPLPSLRRRKRRHPCKFPHPLRILLLALA